ncbi:MAG: VWA domain-containing protein [Candidatus Caldarchaeum sp.]|nr:VWA domain-containing protein [Candidatus Caldarchaeum sp.]
MLEEDFLFFVAEVADRLREYGVKCGTSETIDAYRALSLVRMERVEDLKNVMKLCMIKRLEDYEIFDRVFEDLTTTRRQKTERRQGETGGDGDGGQRTLQRSRESGKDSRQAMMAYYSPVEILSKKDLPVPSLEFIRESRRVMKRLRRRLALLPGRRYEKSLKGVVDFGETIRQSLRNYGEVMRVLRMRRKLTRCKLVAIFDVSGSMDTYTEFLMQSMYSLARQSVAVEVFVFSTKLLRVSSLLSTLGPEEGGGPHLTGC